MLYQETAFHNFERYKSAQMREGIRQDEVSSFYEVPSLILDSLKYVNFLINDKREKGEDKTDSLKLQELLKLEQELVNELRNNHEDYYNFLLKDDVISLKELQDDLDHKDAIIIHFMNYDSLFTTIITHKSCKTFINDAKKVNELVINYYEDIEHQTQLMIKLKNCQKLSFLN
jgi:hypothetical protein